MEKQVFILIVTHPLSGKTIEGVFYSKEKAEQLQHIIQTNCQIQNSEHFGVTYTEIEEHTIVV